MNFLHSEKQEGFSFEKEGFTFEKQQGFSLSTWLFFFFRTSNTIIDAYCLGVLDLFTEALIGGNGPFCKCSAVVFVKRSQ